MIPFNKPYMTGKEVDYIHEAIESGKISGNGMFTERCHRFFGEHFDFHKCLLTTSCTDALEMSALLLNIQPEDEVIIPSYTFVSSALAFVRQGAKIVFIDSQPDHPNLDAEQIEPLINSKTKAIVVVHYAGMACDMDRIMALAKKHDLKVVEDAAQAIDSYYKGRPLGSIGDMSCFSFHETKNVISGEGGMLVLNSSKYGNRPDILWEKGTNRVEFFLGLVNKYGWVDTGSSFLPSELTAAFLFAQLENLGDIQSKRLSIWNRYHESLFILEERGCLKRPVIPPDSTNNGHMYYLVLDNAADREGLINYLRSEDILAVFHYLSLHKSEYYKDKHDGRALPNSDRYSECLVRLPLYYELSEGDQGKIIQLVINYFMAK